jgi:cytochrome P450
LIIFQSEDQAWSHHRRHTAPPFNEKSNVLVWQEAIRLSTEMIEHWRHQYSQTSSPTEFIVANTRADILKLTLYVLCSAGFGVKLPFQNAVEATTTDTKTLFRDAKVAPSGYQFTFRSVMEYLNTNLFGVFFANGIIPKWIPRSMLPFWKTDFDAYDDLVKYFRALISSAETSKSSIPNLLQEMVRSQTHSDQAQECGLSDLEIQGNMFIFVIAGHETTATALRFALVLLAIDQETQNRMSKEIIEALHSQPVDPAKWD